MQEEVIKPSAINYRDRYSLCFLLLIEKQNGEIQERIKSSQRSYGLP